MSKINVSNKFCATILCFREAVMRFQTSLNSERFGFGGFVHEFILWFIYAIAKSNTYKMQTEYIISSQSSLLCAESTNKLTRKKKQEILHNVIYLIYVYCFLIVC